MDVPQDVTHRPWPLPAAPWVLKQAWNDLLFAHWPVKRDRLRDLVPPRLEVDTFNNEAWLTVAPFFLTDLGPRGIPALPWVSAFNEINVRTYVVYEGIPGVYFFSLDANSALAVGGASSLFHLPYFLADIRLAQVGGRHSCRSRRTSGGRAEFQAQYAPAGPEFEPKRGTLDYWLTERYCLYAQDSASRAYRVEIHHAPWHLQEGQAEIAVNTMADASGIRLPAVAPLLHFARRQEVVTWLPQSLR